MIELHEVKTSGENSDVVKVLDWARKLVSAEERDDVPFWRGRDVLGRPREIRC